MSKELKSTMVVKNGEDMTAGSFFNFSARRGRRLPNSLEIKIEISKVKLTNPAMRTMNNHQPDSYITRPMSLGNPIKPITN